MEVEGIANDYYGEPMEEPPQIQLEPIKKGGGGGSETSSQPPISPSGCFDCNICLDYAVDPVVTLCGHLYCWPCIYKWLQIESASPPQCPVCKASVSQDSLVPLYGRGHTTKHSNQTFDIPQRPNSSVHHREHTEIEPESLIPDDHRSPLHRPRHQHYHVHQHEHHHHYPYYSPPSDYVLSAPSSPTLGSTSRVIHSTAGGVLGGMAIAVLPWVFRNHQEAAASASMQFSSPYYAAASGGSPRLRRQEMEVESSLHQIWLFLFCCAMLCLLLF